MTQSQFLRHDASCFPVTGWRRKRRKRREWRELCCGVNVVHGGRDPLLAVALVLVIGHGDTCVSNLLPCVTTSGDEF